MCNSLTQATNGETADVRRALMDSRDGKLYNVSRLADNNCWMVSNLALDGLDGNGKARTLTTADTNINTTEIPSGSVTLESTVQQINDGTTASEYNTPQIYTKSQNTVQTTDGVAMPYGNYYNWNAATAMVGKQATTGTVYSSICPKGWRLPDNGTASGAKTYSNLVSKYTTSVDGTGDYLPTSNVINAAAVARIQQAPLYFPLAGGYNSGYGSSGMGGHGIHGESWSRTVPSSNREARYLYFGVRDSKFYPQNNYVKALANSVRCVLGE